MLTRPNANSPSDRKDLADQMLHELPVWGEWTRSLRFSTPFGEITYDVAAVLYALRRMRPEQALSISEIASLLNEPLAEVRGRIETMLAAGLLGVVQAAENMIDSTYSLTLRGLESSEYTEDVYRSQLLSELDRVSPEELSNLSSALDQLRDILCRLRNH